MKIYTCADKRPDFIELQYRSVNRFIKDKYEYIVLNNGSNPKLRWQIISVCKKLKIKCINVPFRIYPNACIACGWPLQWAIKTQFDFHDINLIIDSDMFFISPINWTKYIDGFDVAGVYQKRGAIEYLWNGILIFNNPPFSNEINLMPGHIEGEAVDVGGNLHGWLSKHKPKTQYFHHTSYINTENGNLKELPILIRKDYKDSYSFEIYDKTILHYSRGSNWNNDSSSYHQEKTALLKKFVEGAIDGSIKLP